MYNRISYNHLEIHSFIGFNILLLAKIIIPFISIAYIHRTIRKLLNKKRKLIAEPPCM